MLSVHASALTAGKYCCRKVITNPFFVRLTRTQCLLHDRIGDFPNCRKGKHFFTRKSCVRKVRDNSESPLRYGYRLRRYHRSHDLYFRKSRIFQPFNQDDIRIREQSHKLLNLLLLPLPHPCTRIRKAVFVFLRFGLQPVYENALFRKYRRSAGSRLSEPAAVRTRQITSEIMTVMLYDCNCHTPA